jgi:hypothetical protein
MGSLKLPIPQSFHAEALNITVREDCRPTPTGSIDIVMLTGSSIRQAER